MSGLRVPMTLRDRTPEDIPFITSAWLRSGRRAAHASHVPDEVYYHHEQALIQRLWREATWLIAVHPKDTTFAYGFLCGEATDAGPVLHYVYVKGDDRRFGVAGELLESFLEGQPRDRGFYTRWTPLWDAVLKRSERFKHSDWIYDPWLASEGAWRS